MTEVNLQLKIRSLEQHNADLLRMIAELQKRVTRLEEAARVSA